MCERKYYSISEEMAKTATIVNSFRDYSEGEATREYRASVDGVYDIVDEIAEKKPELLARAEAMANRYSRKLSEYYNAYYRNEASCPSILVSGGSNFPTRKKERQNSRRDSLMQEWNSLQEYAQKIRNLLYKKQPILSSDENAIQLLEDKLENLKQVQEDMKAANAYYRKNKMLDGCPVLTEVEIRKIQGNWERGWYQGIPFPPYALSNNNQNIHTTEARLEKLKKEKNTETKKTEYKGFSVKENKENMRLQVFFDGDEIPPYEARAILKKNGFRWAPSETAWQRQLTDNARYVIKNIIPKLEEVLDGQEAVQ